MTQREQQIIDLIHREVKPALGCTEPIAVALAVAKAVEIITENCPAACPEGWRREADFKLDVAVSANILKNGMGVGIPGTGMIGLHVAAALGAVCGDSSLGLEVLKNLTEDDVARARELVGSKAVNISVADTEHLLYVKATVALGGASASAEVDPHAYAVIEDNHDRIVETSFADRILMSSESAAAGSDSDNKDLGLTVKEIYEFALHADYKDIEFILEDRTLNLALAREGLEKDYGLKVGKAIRENQQEVFGDDLLSFAMGMTAAASDARMAGSTLPAMSNSGSGNQGITVLPHPAASIRDESFPPRARARVPSRIAHRPLRRLAVRGRRTNRAAGWARRGARDCGRADPVAGCDTPPPRAPRPRTTRSRLRRGADGRVRGGRSNRRHRKELHARHPVWRVRVRARARPAARRRA